MNALEGTGFENLQTYTEFTSNTQDNIAFENLVNTIMGEVPETVTREEVLDAINQAIADEPDATMEEVLEKAVETINQTQDLDDDVVTKLHDAWDTFKSESGLSEDDISAILADPVDAVLSDGDNMSEVSLKKMLAMMYLLMIEIAGKESADELLIGCEQRDEIMEIAKEKAGNLRTKAWVSFATDMTAAAIQIGAGAMSMGAAGKGLNAAKAGQSGLAQSYGGMATAYGSLGGGFSSLMKAGGNLGAGLIDARNAELDGESQVASANMDIANKMRQKAVELLQHLLSMLQGMSQADYQTMTTIGRA